MKKNLLIILASLFPVLMFAQDNKSFIGFNTGVSFPVGKYASKTLDGGSFALPGWTVDVDGAWIIGHGIGVGIQASYYAHPIDVRSLGYYKVIQDEFLLDLTIRSDPYRTFTLAAFSQYTLNLSGHLTITPKIGGGMIGGYSPYQLYKAEYYLIGEHWFEITSTTDYGAYLTAGAAVDYAISDCIGLVFKAEYGYGTLEYRFLTGSGNIRTDVHRFMVADLLLGFRIKL